MAHRFQELEGNINFPDLVCSRNTRTDIFSLKALSRLPSTYRLYSTVGDEACQGLVKHSSRFTFNFHLIFRR